MMMTVDDDLDRLIDQRIARLSRWSRRDARRELKEHIVEAATQKAGGKDVDARHVDAAFDALGDDAAIRDAFFPTTPANPVRIAEAVLLVAATLLVVATQLAEGGNTVSCAASDGGTCTSTKGGYLLDAILTATPPLLVLACRAWLPRWGPWVVAAPYLAFSLLRFESGFVWRWREMIGDTGIVVAALVCVGVALWQYWPKSVVKAHA